MSSDERQEAIWDIILCTVIHRLRNDHPDKS